MNGKTRNDRRKTRRNTDDGGRTDKAGEMRAERNTDRGRNGQREMRAGKRKTEDGKKDGAKSDATKTDRTAESGGKKTGLRNRRPDDTARRPAYNIYFCSPRIRIATSRIVVSSSVTTPPSGPGSKWTPTHSFASCFPPN